MGRHPSPAFRVARRPADRSSAAAIGHLVFCRGCGEAPLIDMTAVSVLDELADACRKHKCRLVISALQRQPRIALHNTGFLRADRVMLARDTPMAIERAKALLSDPDKRCTGLTPIDECGASHGR